MVLRGLRPRGGAYIPNRNAKPNYSLIAPRRFGKRLFKNILVGQLQGCYTSIFDFEIGSAAPVSGPD